LNTLVVVFEVRFKIRLCTVKLHLPKMFKAYFQSQFNPVCQDAYEYYFLLFD